LRLALTAPYEFDRAEEKRAKATLLACWGRGAEGKERLPRGHTRILVNHLVHYPSDFRGALARLLPDLQGLYLSAYQSHLWNRILAARLAALVAPEDLRPVRLKLGELPMPVRLNDELR